MVRCAAPPLSNKPASVYKYDLSQPIKETVLESLSATESSTYLFLVGTGYCLVIVPLTILIPQNQCLRLVKNLQLECPWLQSLSCFQLM